VYGFDELGREVLEFVEGEVPWPERHRRLLGELDSVYRVGALLRSFHDAVASFPVAPNAVWHYPEMATDSEPFIGDSGILICHNDPAAWNLVIGRDRWAFVDWDAAGPRPPIWDVAYCAVGVVPIVPDATHAGWEHPPPYLHRIRALADGYGLGPSERVRLPEIIVARIQSSYQHLRRRAAAGIAPWDQLWRKGHGDAWAAMLRFAEANQATWTSRLAT
jgi:Ser/Thr protein kinase RdoA (MazF antagonist)